MSKEKKLDVVYIEWDDSSYSGGWHYGGGEKAAAKIRSVGIIVHRGIQTVQLATSSDGEGGFLQPVTIPRSAIRKIRKVTCP